MAEPSRPASTGSIIRRRRWRSTTACTAATSTPSRSSFPRASTSSISPVRCRPPGWIRAQTSSRQSGSHTELISAWSPQAPSLEGFLFPDTYKFNHHSTEEQMLGAMVKRFAEVATRLQISPADAKRVVTMASLVEREVRVTSERPLVAGVFENRLRAGMPLQTDPSVIYASLAQRHLDRRDSPERAALGLGVQHLHARGPAARTHLQPWSRGARRQPCIRRRRTTCTLSQIRTGRRSSRASSMSIMRTSRFTGTQPK